MFYAVSKIFWLFAAPSNLIALLMIAGVLLLCARRAKWGRRLTVLGALGYLALAAAPTGHFLTFALENRFPRPAPDMPAPDGVIVLGGAISEAMLKPRGALVLGPSGSRMTEAVALSLKYPAARLVFSGGSANILGDANELSEADVAKLLLEAMGVPPGRFVYEDKSRNTWENAIFTRETVKPKPGERWLLVTSATHMPRAMGIFRQAGFEVTAWPAHYFTTGVVDDLLSVNRQASEGLFLADIAIREWIGLVVYRLTGKSSALFPAP